MTTYRSVYTVPVTDVVATNIVIHQALWALPDRASTVAEVLDLPADLQQEARLFMAEDMAYRSRKGLPSFQDLRFALRDRGISLEDFSKSPGVLVDDQGQHLLAV